MPIYVYKCTTCQEYCEALQKVNDEPLKTCPHCQAQALTRVIAPVGVIFKGTGFHKNDYSAKTNTPTSKTTTESSGSESKSDSAPAESNQSKEVAKPSNDAGGGSNNGSDKVA